MQKILPLLPRPSHYTGQEFGRILKNKDQVRGRIALAFPDLYEVGMSYTGMAILYHAVNQHDDLWAERVFAPSEEAAEVMRERGVPLSALESGDPLHEFDLVGFHITHELCYTNVLFMLDLAGVPFRASDRGLDQPLDGPLILAGGGQTLNAEPLAPFIDIMALGEGEELLPEILQRIVEGKERRLTKRALLRELAAIPGVYIPAFFEEQGSGMPLRPLFEDYPSVEKRLLADLDDGVYPRRSTQAFDAVHSRYTIEIARGCTRGCRFCHAGMVYRPVRERSLPTLKTILEEGLEQSGYEELSFLALSAGDFSSLSGLFEQSLDKCRQEQVSISLPSLRVGSVSGDIMRAMAGLRRTGATLAPEAGSQRLRNVINKGVTEEELLNHVQVLAQNGWRSVKLYFMIGLPTETEEDLAAIPRLCLHVAKAAKDAGAKGFAVTAAISPFVPKPHTPFQWERQLTLEETRERIGFVRELFSKHKRLGLKWHMPEMSYLEGVFSRGERRLAEVVERAYAKGALFSSWNDKLKLAPWLEALEECEIEPNTYLQARDPDAPLPWDMINCGVSKQFLLKERERAYAEKSTEDCRFGVCRNCGVCNHEGRVSLLQNQGETQCIHTRVNLEQRDQETEVASTLIPREDAPAHDSRPLRPEEVDKSREALGLKAVRYRIWYTKVDAAAFLSQLELQAMFERAIRRSGLKPSFSRGFHPLPLLSFARALPVGVSSLSEYIDVFFRTPVSAAEVEERLASQFVSGVELIRVETLPLTGKQPQAEQELFLLKFTGESSQLGEFVAAWKIFKAMQRFEWTRQTKKGARTTDIRPMFSKIDIQEDGRVALVFDWRQLYLSPLSLVRAAAPELELDMFTLVKVEQRFPQNKKK